MKKLCLLLLLLLLPVLGQAEALPVLRLDTPVLDYVAVKPGRLTLGDFVTPVTAKYRGSYSVTFTGKRNYSLHVKDEKGEQRKVSLLGLREDDDYVLLGALSDPSRLRNVIGLELWRALGHAAPCAAPCELYFGDYYKGIYFLTERPDRKSAGVPKSGALYRVLAARVDGVDLFSCPNPGAPGEETWYNVGREYGDWTPLQSFLAADDPLALLDLPAFADYCLYVNLIGATDNMKKNLYLGWDGDGLFPMPWDLDAAFGRLYTGEPSDPDAWFSGPLPNGLMQSEAFQALLRQRWQAIRDILSPEAVMARFAAWHDRLGDAWQREADRFPAYTDSSTGLTYPLAPEAELQLIRQYLEHRYALMNALFGE